MSTDPLLRAVARGDAKCPDGASLARLGALARAASTPSRADLRDRVRDRLAAEPAVDGDAPEDEVGAWLDGRPDPALDRLREVLRAAGGPRPADLRERVRAAISPTSLRLTPQQAERAGRRWRLVAAIAAAHVAAVLLFTSLSSERPTGTAAGDSLQVATDRSAHAVTARDWRELRERKGDVLAPRRSELARETARADARLGDTARSVSGMLRWLMSRQDPATGRIAAGTGDRAVATQALAALALLGEGGGDQTRLTRARLALGPVAAALAGVEPLSPAALSAGTLALVEGSLLIEDPELRLAARAALLRLTREMPGRPHEGGLAGLGWLAFEAAAAGRIELPEGAVEAARERIALRLPDASADAGRVGLAAYARLVTGQRNDAATRALISGLAAHAPATAPRLDPLAWFLSGLAMHAEGGPAWTAWAEGLRAGIIPRLAAEGTTMLRLPGDAVRHADGDDVLATALGVLALQAPYRYVVPSGE